MPRRSRFVHLGVRTHFSFLAGASTPEKLVVRAKELGFDAIGIADVHGLYGIVRALEESEKHGLRLIVGAEILVVLDAHALEPETFRVIFHVENHAGYINLCRILTHAHGRRPRDDRSLANADLAIACAHSNGLWATLMPRVEAAPVASNKRISHALSTAFGSRFSVAATFWRTEEDRALLNVTRELERTFGAHVCATNDVRFATRAEKPVLDVLTCIDEGITLDNAGTRLLSNAEAHLKSEEEMEKLFALNPTWIDRTRVIADACTFSMRELKMAYAFPSDLNDIAQDVAQALEAKQGARGCREEVEKPTANDVLRHLAYEGLKKRYPSDGSSNITPERYGQLEEQIEKELAIIAEIDVAPYFLSVREIVNIAREKDILCQGRGSAANSAVCYCLGITAVDPSRSSLLFERFLSPERKEPPDIDVDFEHERREEVIQEIYARYGRDRAAMVSEVICYRGKSALRDVGKAFGMSLEETERLSTLVSFWDSARAVDAKKLIAAGFDPLDRRLRMVVKMSRSIAGFPRHLSIHVGGFVLSARPLEEVAPIEPATMEDRTVVPWDKDDIDTLGFFKVDVLGLGMLTAIRKALKMIVDPDITATHAIEQLAQIPPEDHVVYDALCRADTVGVFQIESRAQMSMLPRLRPSKFYDLVIEVAIVRPGPIQGGMVHPYLRRRNGEEAIDSPHACLEPILARTLGVPLFQEQVMQIAIVGAGYSGGEADQLRRDMAAWRKNGNLMRHEERLHQGFRARGISEEFSRRLFSQIQGFGEYGFPESHAASFALLVYASAWLKVHHPAAFAAALINSQPMGFYSPSTILEDAGRHHVEVLPICVLSSDWDCTVRELELEHESEPGEREKLRVGLRQISNLGEETGRHIVAMRTKAPFTSIEDVEKRAGLRKDEMNALAEAGAFACFESKRREAIWEAGMPRALGLFEGHASTMGDTPEFPAMTRGEQLVLDYERTGISTTDHAMRVVRPELPTRVKSSRDLHGAPTGARITTAGLVICRQRPMTASGVVFATLEDEFGFINLVMWERVFEQYRFIATSSSLLWVEGKLQRDKNVIHVVVQHLERLSLAGRNAKRVAEVPSRSRDFH